MPDKVIYVCFANASSTVCVVVNIWFVVSAIIPKRDDGIGGATYGGDERLFVFVEYYELSFKILGSCKYFKPPSPCVWLAHFDEVIYQ